MKKLVFIMFLFLNLYADDTCTEEQVAKMIKQNISQKTIDKVCKKIIPNDDEKEINELLEDYKETKTIEEKVDDKEEKVAENNDNKSLGNIEKEHFFFRIGLGYFGSKEIDYEEFLFSFGVHYYINGLDEDGLGFALSFADAEKEKDEYSPKRYDSKFISQVELIYNLALKDSYNMAGSLIVGSYTEELISDDYKTTYSTKETDVYGLGVYLTFPGVTKNGHGVSLFYKGLNTYGEDSNGKENDQTIHLVGADFIW